MKPKIMRDLFLLEEHKCFETGLRSEREWYGADVGNVVGTRQGKRRNSVYIVRTICTSYGLKSV